MKITKFRVNGQEAPVAQSALEGQLLPPRPRRMQVKFLSQTNKVSINWLNLLATGR